MADTQSLFFFDEALSQFNDLIEKTSSQEEKERLKKIKEEIVSQQKAEDKQAIKDLP